MVTDDDAEEDPLDMPSLTDAIDNYQTFNIPPNKTEKRKYFGNNLINRFKSQFETLSWNIPHYATSSFHTLLGALPNVRDIEIRVANNYEDCRIHTFLLMESGAGKGGGFSYTHKVAEEVGLHFRPTGDLTNASIVGTIDDDEVKPGYLHPDFNDGNPVDVFASSEASQVIDTNSEYYDKNSVTNLQKCMNRLGSVDNQLEKKLGSSNRLIVFNSHASLYFTSYPPSKLFSTITKTGLLQRMILIHVPVTLKDKLDAGLKHAEMLENDQVDKIEKGISPIVDALEYINDFYQGINTLELTKGAKQVLMKRIVPEFFKPLINIDNETMHELKKFTTRYQVITYKLAWHHAISRLSKKVEVQDMAYAKKVMMPIFNSLIAFMENEFRADKGSRIQSKKEREAIKKAYKVIAKKENKKRPWVLKSVLLDKIKREKNITIQASRHILMKHISMFKTAKDKRDRNVLRLRKDAI